MRNKILIYEDYGCSDVSQLAAGLREYFEPKGCSVGFTDAAGIIKNNELNEDVLAFFMPGGAGTPYRHKLEVYGNEKIRSYVRAGGMYYGICAGAYYACEKTVFEADIPELRIVSRCGLDLIKGTAVGTLYKELGILPYSRNASSSAVVELLWHDTDEKYVSHYHGGPYFEVENDADTAVLACYNLPEKPAAVLKRRYGKGCVVVSGVHYEDKGETLLKAVHQMQMDSDKARQVAKKLLDGETSRRALFNKLMNLSGR